MKVNLSLVALLQFPSNCNLKLLLLKYGLISNIEVMSTICTLCYKSWKRKIWWSQIAGVGTEQPVNTSYNYIRVSDDDHRT